ncbi:DJ-1/PfpI family protein [Microtetraspora sp. NBRC 16547]|uniref:DJ-1/PfpI family protein n=1 Tax=Microtetraspora sp. NBRC 16547 TaxID=3030993 RepID=UPI0024A50435|nr:DJ-1/PfpI family protein [Microtetraspora sp. NBRC 16547]GLW99919.1 thiazole biosynthesis protein ThiJ [Microtetraspora sp. NBRC 16547]
MTKTHVTKTIAFVLYPGLTALDVVGPLQVLSGLAQFDPAYRVVVLAKDTAPLPSDTPLALAASHTFDEIAEADVLVVPGGTEGTLAALADDTLLGWIRHAAAGAEVVGSVCTGSLLLGAAGLLEGRRATSHWAMRHLLERFGAVPVAERWVEDGPFITAAGVAAGIDMALALVERLAGEEMARMVQLWIEYDPQPPLGGIDWDKVDIPSYRPIADGLLASTLAGHPELLARLTA